MRSNFFNEDVGPAYTQFLRNQDDDWYINYIHAVCRKRGFHSIHEFEEWRKKEGLSRPKALGFAPGKADKRLDTVFQSKGLKNFYHDGSATCE